ncbi:(2Fe-2S)-binding protein [Nocardioides sp. GXZ039]|uniref:(2Fe-2S)-binding protein n=1 Tax=Nocardioides sp. GXZ039 TaxID=3136018 RepID=UPI0030F43F32
MPDSSRVARPGGDRFEIAVDGQPAAAYDGDTLAAAMVAAGITRFHSGVDDSPRMVLCNMGTCFECTVTVDEVPLQRACLIAARPGMVVTTESAR